VRRLRLSFGHGRVHVQRGKTQDNAIRFESQGTMRDLRKCLDIDICAAVFFYNRGLSRLPIDYQYPAVLVTLRQSGGRQQ